MGRTRLVTALQPHSRLMLVCSEQHLMDKFILNYLYHLISWETGVSSLTAVGKSGGGAVASPSSAVSCPFPEFLCRIWPLGMRCCAAGADSPAGSSRLPAARGCGGRRARSSPCPPAPESPPGSLAKIIKKEGGNQGNDPRRKMGLSQHLSCRRWERGAGLSCYV